MGEPPQTHVNLHHSCPVPWFEHVRGGSVELNHHKLMSISTTGLVSLPCAMVQAGSEGLSHPELMSSSTTGLVPFPVLWCEEV